MKSKIALFLAALLFFNIILPTKVLAASVQDQSKPIFGLTADQVVEKYNQLTDQQKDQVLRSLGNTSIFANSLFGNIFNSTFGALDDAVKKLGDLFFQANGVVYRLGSSALAWVSRLIDKVFNNDLNDLNIGQPVVNDFYLNTKDLIFVDDPIFVSPNYPSWVTSSQWTNILPLPVSSTKFAYVYKNPSVEQSDYILNVYVEDSFDTFSSPYYITGGVVVDLDSSLISVGRLNYTLDSDNKMVLYSFSNGSVYNYNGWLYLYRTIDWGSRVYLGFSRNVIPSVSFQDSYLDELTLFLNNYFIYCDYYYLIDNGFVYKILISSDPVDISVTNNTYYNFIYNIPDQTPLNINNIVSNTAINFDPVENLIQYLPDNYNIEQNFSVVNNYYISSGSAITGQAIDVNIVSPGVIDVRVINPEDLTQQVTNNVSKDIINNTDVNFGDLDFSPSVTVGLTAAKDSIEGIVPVTGSSIVAQFVSGIPPDWLALGFVFLILFIVSGFGMSIIRH